MISRNNSAHSLPLLFHVLGVLEAVSCAWTWHGTHWPTTGIPNGIFACLLFMSKLPLNHGTVESQKVAKQTIPLVTCMAWKCLVVLFCPLTPAMVTWEASWWLLAKQQLMLQLMPWLLKSGGSNWKKSSTPSLVWLSTHKCAGNLLKIWTSQTWSTLPANPFFSLPPWTYAPRGNSRKNFFLGLGKIKKIKKITKIKKNYCTIFSQYLKA